MVENLGRLAFAVAALAFLAGSESSGSDGAGSWGNGGVRAARRGPGAQRGGGVVQVAVFHISDEEGGRTPDAVTNPDKVSGGVANFRAWLAAEGYVPGGGASW